MSEDSYKNHPMWKKLYFGTEVVKIVLGVSIIQVVWKKRTFPNPTLVVVNRDDIFFAVGKRFSSLEEAEEYIRENPPVKGDGRIPLP